MPIKEYLTTIWYFKLQFGVKENNNKFNKQNYS